jgi:hypothetical protein
VGCWDQQDMGTMCLRYFNSYLLSEVFKVYRTFFSHATLRVKDFMSTTDAEASWDIFSAYAESHLGNLINQ